MSSSAGARASSARAREDAYAARPGPRRRNARADGAHRGYMRMRMGPAGHGDARAGAHNSEAQGNRFEPYRGTNPINNLQRRWPTAGNWAPLRPRGNSANARNSI